MKFDVESKAVNYKLGKKILFMISPQISYPE